MAAARGKICIDEPMTQFEVSIESKHQIESSNRQAEKLMGDEKLAWLVYWRKVDAENADAATAVEGQVRARATALF